MKRHCMVNITSSRLHRSWVPLLSGSLLLLLLAVSLLKALPARADAPIVADLTTSHFGITFLQVTPGNLSDARHATFTITNRSGFWYGFTVSSTPDGIRPQAADPSNDPLGAAFTSEMVLQPADVIPTGQPGLDLAVSFSAPDQQMQMTLNPFDSNAGALNALRLVENIIGVACQSCGTVGLAKPDTIKQVLDSLDKVGTFAKLVSDFIAAEQAPSQEAAQGHIGDFFNGLLAISGNDTLRDQFAAILAEMVSQRAFPHIDFNALLKVIPLLGSLSVLIQFGVAFVSTLANSLFADVDYPTVTLTSRLANPATPTNSATPNLVETDTPTSGPQPTDTPTLTPIATSIPPTPTDTPTPASIRIVSFTADHQTTVPVGTTVILTVQTNLPVDNYGYTIYIQESVSNTTVNYCTSGTICTAQFLNSEPQSITCEAYVADQAGNPVVFADNFVTITWQ
jgi:hypothetical protein